MADVDLALRVDAQIGSRTEGNLQTLDSKKELLHLLLENEQMRLIVWLYPLDHERSHVLHPHSSKTLQDVRANTTLLTFFGSKADLRSFQHLLLQRLGRNILVLQSS